MVHPENEPRSQTSGSPHDKENAPRGICRSGAFFSEGIHYNHYSVYSASMKAPDVFRSLLQVPDYILLQYEIRRSGCTVL